jgi:hypothetical protein
MRAQSAVESITILISEVFCHPVEGGGCRLDLRTLTTRKVDPSTTRIRKVVRAIAFRIAT